MKYMYTKLTLSLDKEIIEAAKKYAKENKVSISKLVENHLKSLALPSSSQENEITPIVKELSGIISPDALSNIKNHYADYLIEKYK